MPFRKETIWIIGASSGIGRALAHDLSQRGATLILSARSEDKLTSLKEELGGDHMICPLDVTDPQEFEQTFTAITKSIKQIDRAIYLAGFYEPSSIEKTTPDIADKIMQVNFIGALRFTQIILPYFKEQKRGQLVLCGSIAGTAGLPHGQPYSASKAALINFAESLHAEAERFIDIKIINPGFVRTPLTDKNTFKMPMMIEPEDAAKAIAKGLNTKSFEIHFPKGFTIWFKILNLLPYSLKLFFLEKFKP